MKSYENERKWLIFHVKVTLGLCIFKENKQENSRKVEKVKITLITWYSVFKIS